MKIGLYGGMNNNLYTFAKVMARGGEDILFIRDSDQTFAHGQPFWEDVRLSIPYKQDGITGYHRTMQEWMSFEAEQGWQAPSWMVVPAPSDKKAAPVSGLIKSLDRAFLERIYAKQFPEFENVLWQMQQCDFILACGTNPTILAYLSGVPYMPLPYGTDIRIATGFFKLVSKTFKDRLANLYYKAVLKRAFNNAQFIGTSDPSMTGAYYKTDISKKLKRGLHHARIGLPYDMTPAYSTEEKRTRAISLFKELGIKLPEYDHLVLIPSRIDFAIKGHDRLLEAILELPSENGLHFVFLGWGNDYDKVSQRFDSDGFSVLPAILSKPMLLELLQIADLVIDQFLEGTYGSLTCESISVGTPVMIYIDNKTFEAKGWSAPPVLSASNKAEISSYLNLLAMGELDLSKFSRDLQFWMARVHESSYWLKYLKSEIQKSMG